MSFINSIIKAFVGDKSQKDINLNNPRLYFLIFNLIFLVLVFMSNAYIYTKSGMNFRYFIPSILGFSFVVVSFLNYSSNLSFKVIYVLIISAIVDITLYISPLLTTILADEPSSPFSLAENSIPKARKLFKSFRNTQCHFYQ